VIKSVKRLFNKEKEYFKTRTFTYFVPAPPNRKTGYQEKEFDQICQHLVGKDFDIIDIKMEAFANNTSAGVWILCILGAKTQKAANMSLEIEYSDVANQHPQHIQTDPLIEHDH
jgi:hypothetical protein